MFYNLDLSPGKVVYDDFDINSELPLSEQIYSLKEDLFQLNYNDKYIIDIGWYPEFDVNGTFSIVLIEDFNWQHPLEKKSCRDIETLQLYMEEFMCKFKNLTTNK